MVYFSDVIHVPPTARNALIPSLKAATNVKKATSLTLKKKGARLVRKTVKNVEMMNLPRAQNALKVFIWIKGKKLVFLAR